MVTINKLRVYLQRCMRHVLHILFPDTRDLRAFLQLSASALQKRSSACTHPCALFSYQDPLIKAGVRALKYSNRRTVATKFAPYIRERLHPCLLIPIPASPRRMKQYGFNQCETLCIAVRHIYREAVYTPHALTRVTGEVSQTTLNRADRVRNVQHAFTATEAVRGMHVIIIDDVLTTGATLDAARRACLQAGAASVHILAVAHQPLRIR